MSRALRAFRISARVALAAATVTAAATITAAVVGALALSGQVTYPVTFGIGPLHFQDTISTEVQLEDDICQTAHVESSTPNSECTNYFVHADSSTESYNGNHWQDADVRPTSAHLTGTVELASTGTWSPYVAAQVVKKVAVGATVTGWLVLVWRLLAATAAGEAFSSRTVRTLRLLGWLTIAAAALHPALAHFTNLYQVGYSTTSFNEATPLQPWNSIDGYPRGVNIAQVTLGGLVLLIAEIFRHGAAIEADNRLTV